MSEARIHNPITCSGKEYWVPHDVACHISELITRLADSEKALRELVACKDLKEEIIELAMPNTEDSPELSALNAEYKRRQPLAWKAARTALAKP